MHRLKYLLTNFLLLFASVGCNKKDDHPASCAWFPITNKTTVNYRLSAQRNLEPATVTPFTASVTNRNTLDVDGYKFTLSDCDAGKITLTYGANITNMLAVDKNAAIGTVLSSDANGKFQKQLLVGDTIYAYIPTNVPYAYVTVNYVSNKGITMLNTVSPTVNNVTMYKSYVLQ